MTKKLVLIAALGLMLTVSACKPRNPDDRATTGAGPAMVVLP